MESFNRLNSLQHVTYFFESCFAKYLLQLLMHVRLMSSGAHTPPLLLCKKRVLCIFEVKRYGI